MSKSKYLINGVHYHVRVTGTGEPLVLLHGFSGSSENWATITKSLETCYQLIAPDLLGHGQTDAPLDPARYGIDNAARDLSALCQRLGLDSAHWLGYSMGGRLALYLALTYPQAVRTLTLESASPGLASPEARTERVRSDEALAERSERDGIESFTAYWESIPLFASQSGDVRAALRPVRLKNNPLGLANSLRGMGTGAQPSLWDRLPELAMPVSLIAGELDTKFAATARQMHAAIPQSNLAIIPGAGHTAHQEQPEVFMRAIPS
jgi:2-succinyl-6-hydroxy-2,4-cyclohexadiene-1-carboxylate synthase